MFKISTDEKKSNNKQQTAYVGEGVSITPMPVTMMETVTIEYDDYYHKIIQITFIFMLVMDSVITGQMFRIYR